VSPSLSVTSDSWNASSVLVGAHNLEARPSAISSTAGHLCLLEAQAGLRLDMKGNCHSTSSHPAVRSRREQAGAGGSRREQAAVSLHLSLIPLA